MLIRAISGGTLLKTLPTSLPILTCLCLEGDPHPPALVYAKMSKSRTFVEKDTSDYQIYSVVTNRRMTEIETKTFLDVFAGVALECAYRAIRSQILELFTKVSRF